MFKKVKYLAAALMIVTSAASAFAIPARPGVQTVVQPDGTSIRVINKGDEFFHYTLTEDGYLLLPAADGLLYYATMAADGVVKASDVRATNVETRTETAKSLLSTIDAKASIDRYVETSVATLEQQCDVSGSSMRKAGPGLKPGTGYSAKGKGKGLAILVQYKDVKFNLKDPHDFFNRMLNEPGFKDYGNTGSCRDFFIDSSFGQFQPEFDLYGPVTLSGNRADYGGAALIGQDKNVKGMIKEACQLIDSQVDFRKYDTDGDGAVDFVYVFYADRGENGDGPAESVWPQSSNFTILDGGSFDGVRLDRWACSNEWYGNEPEGVGTFCHEFSHVLGLIDVYTTSYNANSFTPGEWEVMDAGSYNNAGHTPPSHSAWERYALGWLEPTVINKAMNVDLDNLYETNRAYIIPTNSSNEYFMLENRQKVKWDKYLPGHGMLIWHIDYNASLWSTNKANNTPSHQYIDLEEADNIQSEETYAGDAFPGTAKKTSFTDNTTPSMKPWSGSALNLPITDIKEANKIISFKVKGGVAALTAPVVNETPVEMTSTTLTPSWSKVTNATHYLVTLKKGTLTVVADHLDVGKVNQYKFTDLTPGAKYKFTVQAFDGNQYSPESTEVAFLLPKVEDGVEGVTADDCDNSFTLDGLNLTVETVNDTPVMVYDLAGRIVASAYAIGGETNITLPTSGLYILRIGNQAAKILVK